MISRKHKLIFLHVPKTGGNAISTYLLSHSDDHKVLDQVQDGVHRFEIQGPITPHKHALLQDYQDRLNESLSDYTVMITLRHPIDRALSLYYSPHRIHAGMRRMEDEFDFDAFASLVSRNFTICDFLRIDGAIRQPDIVLNFDTLALDLQNAAQRLGLPQPYLQTLNVSADSSGERERLKSDPRVREICLNRFAEVYDTFGLAA